MQKLKGKGIMPKASKVKTISITIMPNKRPLNQAVGPMSVILGKSNISNGIIFSPKLLFSCGV